MSASRGRQAMRAAIVGGGAGESRPAPLRASGERRRTGSAIARAPMAAAHIRIRRARAPARARAAPRARSGARRRSSRSLCSRVRLALARQVEQRMRGRLPRPLRPPGRRAAAPAGRRGSRQRAFQAVAFRPLRPPRSERQARKPCERSRSAAARAALAGGAHQQVAAVEVERARPRSVVWSWAGAGCVAGMGSAIAFARVAHVDERDIPRPARRASEANCDFERFVGRGVPLRGPPRPRDAPRNPARAARAAAACSG